MEKRKKTQSMVEYTFIIGVAALALGGMATYGQRGIQAIIKLSSDGLGEQEKFVSSGSLEESDESELEASDLGGRTVRSENKILNQVLEEKKASQGIVEEKKGSYWEVRSKSHFEGSTTRDKEF